jgi:hypothetical protein
LISFARIHLSTRWLSQRANPALALPHDRLGQHIWPVRAPARVARLLSPLRPLAGCSISSAWRGTASARCGCRSVCDVGTVARSDNDRCGHRCRSGATPTAGFQRPPDPAMAIKRNKQASSRGPQQAAQRSDPSFVEPMAAQVVMKMLPLHSAERDLALTVLAELIVPSEQHGRRP